MLTAVGATVAFAVALSLAGAARGMALYGYLLLLAALGMCVALARLRGLLPTTPAFDELYRRRNRQEERVEQLDALSRRLTADVHHRLRPLVSEIAAARLARRHGVDLTRRPEQACELVGPRTWELVRPDREPPDERSLRGWSERELRELVDELEQI